MLDRTPPAIEPTVQVATMPADTNAYGDIFGGWLMGQMDTAAGLVAARRSRGRAVTVAMDGMQFHVPVSVGDEVSVYAQLVKVGRRTSMVIGVEAWRRQREGEDLELVTQARFTFVTVGADNWPTP